MRTVDHDPGLYGRSFADVYDAWYGDVSDVEGTVNHVRLCAAGGPVLELGSGTGRLMAPLAAAGVPVTALDASPEMNRRLRRRIPGAEIVEADMARLPLRGRHYATVLIAFNTICNLVAPGAQTRCVAEAARVLRPGGVLVVELLVPPDPSVPAVHGTSVRGTADGVTVLMSTTAGGDDDHVLGRHIEVGDDGSHRVRPWELRWLAPSRLDTMAARAGLRLEHRWADWSGTRFDADADSHVSTYRRTG